MYAFLLFTADFTPWQQTRIYSACRAYLSILDPGFDAEVLCLDDRHVGWWFYLTTDEARQNLIAFFSALIGKVAENRSMDEPTIMSAGAGDVVTVSSAIEEASR